MKKNTNETSLIKVSDNFFSKIKKIIKSLFKRKLKNKEIKEEIRDGIINNNESKRKFEQRIKSEINNSVLKKIKKEKFIQEIEHNPELRNLLTNDRLEKISKYYEELINELEIEINNLKKRCGE